MATLNKYIKDWKRILLDTSTLCCLFRSQNPDSGSEYDLFVKKLITYLGSTKTGKGEERIFVVSSVTISELITSENDAEKIKKILKVLNSSNVEFVDFDLQVALDFNYHLYECLNKTFLHERAKELGFKTNEYAMAREWITRDFMILLTGVTNKADAIFTSDKKTFYPNSKNIPTANCILTYPELFEHSGTYIINYYYDKVEEFLRTGKVSEV